MKNRFSTPMRIAWPLVALLACFWAAPEIAAAEDPAETRAWTEVAKLMAGDPGDWEALGSSIAVEGDTVVVGAWRDDGYKGAIYVYVKPAGGWSNMTEVAKLTHSDGEAGDSLGTSVAICGDTIVAGAPEKHDLYSGAGAAYVFVKPAGGWTNMTETAKLLSSDLDRNDYLGWSVSVDNDTIAVGAYGEGGGAGAAYVFVEPGGGWAGLLYDAGKLEASDGVWPDSLGIAVAVSGDTVAAGAYADSHGSFNAQGSIYVFVKPGGGWFDMYETAKLTASDNASSDNLGKSVSMVGDTIAAGAYGDDNKAGSVYIFERPIGGWTSTTEIAKLTASDADSGDQLGISVCLDGATLVAGADYECDNGPQAGAIYVFDMPAGGWVSMTETDKLITSDGVSWDYFGYSAAVDGNTVAGGAWGDDDGGFQAGSAYVFERPADDPLPDVKANGSDGPLTVTQGTNLRVVISLDPGDQAGSSADWWVLVDSPFGWYRYVVTSGLWTPGVATTHQGTLSVFGPVTVYNRPTLPVGSYTFHFGVDMLMNGVPDLSEMYFDSVDVTVQ